MLHVALHVGFHDVLHRLCGVVAFSAMTCNLASFLEFSWVKGLGGEERVELRVKGLSFED